LLQHNGDTLSAARALGISRPTLYRKMKKYGINLKQ
jgi:transcriptional regulator of acetoin/glycerol metabolism